MCCVPLEKDEEEAWCEIHEAERVRQEAAEKKIRSEDELLTKIFNSTEGVRHKIGALLMARENPEWIPIGMAWFRRDAVTLILRQPDGSLVLALPGGGVNVPLTESSRILEVMGIPKEDPAPPSGEPAIVYRPSGNMPEATAGHCGKCGKVIADPDQPESEYPARWLCQCDPS